MKYHKSMPVFVFIVTLAYASFAQAIFIDAGGGMVYDTELDVTWLKDANYAMTSGYDADGLMNWNDSVAWASSLTVGGVNGWRLPTMTTSSGGALGQMKMVRTALVPQMIMSSGGFGIN